MKTPYSEVCAEIIDISYNKIYTNTLFYTLDYALRMLQN